MKTNSNNNGRISILEAVVWAQEHHNQVMYLADTSHNIDDYMKKLKEKYCFNREQAQAIVNMQSREFTIQNKEETKKELQELLNKQL
jgi:DNA gyrase/topoisomerase IV subunit A